MKIAINGFGRIGRTFLRAVLEDTSARAQLEVAAINTGQPMTAAEVAHLFTYDTVMGRYRGKVEYRERELVIDGYSIPLIHELRPDACNWAGRRIDWVVDCTGAFTTREKAAEHLAAGAGHVLISAPAEGDVLTVIPGVNDAAYTGTERIVSLGSCTTNALAPTIKVLHDAFKLEGAMMTTTHAYTMDQSLLDGYHHDPRRARAAACNIVPTSTGASKVVGKLFPDISGLLTGVSIRVPVPKVSLIDLVFSTHSSLSVATINAVWNAAAESERLRGIVGVSGEPLVSSDYAGSSLSVTIDLPLTQVCGRMGKVFGWYDNEWGYSCRLRDFLVRAA